MEALKNTTPDLTATFTPAERWALTKSAIISMKVQDGLYDPEEMDPETIMTRDEHKALLSAFEKLNPKYYGQSASA